MNRRGFIKNGCTACLSVSLLSAMVQACTPTRFVEGKIIQDGLIINKNDFKIKQKGGTAYRSFIIIRNDALKFPVCLYRFNENEYKALWMKCSHQGAELQAAGDMLYCPAHGSEFNNSGMVTHGPASNKLRDFPVTVDNEELFIDMRKQS